MGGRLVTIASFSTDLEAQLAKSKLESSGIFATIFDGDVVSVNWMYSNAVGGVKVKVYEEDLAEAREILEEVRDEENGKSQEAEALDACPRCGSSDVESLMDRRGPMLSWLLLGFPILPVRKRRRCRGCGNEWKPG